MAENSDEIATVLASVKQCLAEVDRIGLTRAGALLQEVIDELTVGMQASKAIDKIELSERDSMLNSRK